VKEVHGSALPELTMTCRKTCPAGAVDVPPLAPMATLIKPGAQAGDRGAEVPMGVAVGAGVCALARSQKLAASIPTRNPATIKGLRLASTA
jgi:hypothetical protein